MNILPNIDECGVIAGTRKSGKTFFAKWLISAINGKFPRFIFDLKGEDQLIVPGCVVCYNADSAYQWLGVRDVLYRPQSLEDSDYVSLDAMLQEVYNRGNIFTYIDELGRFVKNYRPMPGMLDVMCRGRKRNRNGQTIYTPMVVGFQRPVDIPGVCLYETDCFYTFFLRGERDRRRMVEITDDEGMYERPSLPHGFRFLRSGMAHSVEFGPLGVRSIVQGVA